MAQSHTDLSDADLVKAAQRDIDAFDALYHRYVDRIFRYCYARTHNHADAEDLTGQVFVAALDALSRYRERHTFAAWLFGIARNTCAHHHRAQYAHPETSLDDDCPLTAIDAQLALVANTPTPEQATIRHELRECLRRALRMLSDDRREALNLRFWGGLTAREAAHVMHRDAGAIKMLVWRGINDLRKRCLNDE